MSKYRQWSIVLVLAMVLLGWFIYASQTKTTGFFAKYPFKLGLDLAGGTELIYRADTSQISSTDTNDAMNTLKDVIERRVNLFGVSEPIIQVEGAGTFSKDNKLVVDLPGVTDIKEAIALIGKTPTLEFKLLNKNIPPNTQISSTTDLNQYFTPTGLTGRYLSRATVEYNNTTGQPIVGLQFNTDGANLFQKITRENVGRTLAIFLDNELISNPTIQEEISGGKAQINGTYGAQEARDLVRNLNYGSLPLPIELVSTQTIGPSLGASALFAGMKAGIWGFAIVALFLILWYRLPGFIASVALIMYVLISLAAFKFIPVTLTAAGLAGFILSIGMAVDANILIFERMKEELKRGRGLDNAMHEGFHRAWLSIRDSNISSIITAVVLFWLGTSAVKGFALTLGLGVLISMFTAITVSRTFLFAVSAFHDNKVVKFLFGSGLTHSDIKSKA
jgi:preprotein translocase subunit SecD